LWARGVTSIRREISLRKTTDISYSLHTFRINEPHSCDQSTTCPLGQSNAPIRTTDAGICRNHIRAPEVRHRSHHGRDGTEAGSYLRLIDFCITQLKAQGPSRTCNESKEEEEEEEETVPEVRRGAQRRAALLLPVGFCSEFQQRLHHLARGKGLINAVLDTGKMLHNCFNITGKIQPRSDFHFQKQRLNMSPNQCTSSM